MELINILIGEIYFFSIIGFIYLFYKYKKGGLFGVPKELE
mgnify:CR=1 FL=1